MRGWMDCVGSVSKGSANRVSVGVRSSKVPIWSLGPVARVSWSIRDAEVPVVSQCVSKTRLDVVGRLKSAGPRHAQVLEPRWAAPIGAMDSLTEARFPLAAPILTPIRPLTTRLATLLSTRALQIAVFLACLSALAGSAGASPQATPESLLKRVEGWSAAPSSWSGLSDRASLQFLSDLKALASAPEATPATWELLLRTMALEDAKPGKANVVKISRKARAHLVSALRRRTGTTPEDWALSRVILSGPTGRGPTMRGRFVPTLRERQLCLQVLENTRVADLRLALLTVGRREKDPLRSTALGSLGRWASVFGADDTVDLFLVQLLGKAFDKRTSPHPYNVILNRLSSSEEPLGERASELLRTRIKQMFVSADWRETARALRLSAGLAVTDRVPLLLDGLNVWSKRAKSGKEYDGLTRVRGDLVRALRELSGQSHGVEPRPWIDWWVAVRQGNLPMPGTPEFEAARLKREKEPRSTASFFGLRPESRRVTFVIDFSGSMRTGFSTDGNSRYVEAVEQMMRFLQGAPKGTRFNTILFSSDTISSGSKLQPATPKRLEAARRALLKQSPEGGTHLRPAIEEALKLDRSGLPDLKSLEADTIIVLCDGETEEGSAWVRPMLDRVLPIYPVVFHAVHLGNRSDGALQALAEGSGGSYIRVGG